MTKDQRAKEIVDVCFAIMKLWMANPDKTLSWVLKKLNETQ
jgi:hypothetical protein